MRLILAAAVVLALVAAWYPGLAVSLAGVGGIFAMGAAEIDRAIYRADNAFKTAIWRTGDGLDVQRAHRLEHRGAVYFLLWAVFLTAATVWMIARP